LYALGRWAYRHHRRVTVFWVLAIVALGVAAAGLGGGTKNSFEILGTESQSAIDSLGRTFPQLSGASSYLIAVAPAGKTIGNERFKALIADAIKDMKEVEGVTEVVSPYSDLTDIQVSKDERAAMVLIQFDRPLTDVTPAQIAELDQTGSALRDAGYTAKFGGDIFTNTGPKLSIIEVVGVAVAFLVLFLTFDSLRAAVMPIATALVGVIVTTELTFIATGFLTISSTAPLLALMIGLAVGIDYALFILSRHREQLAEGIEPEESAARAVATAGSAVVFAGVTVMIALLGLSVARIPFLTVMGIVAAIAVLVAVGVALTLLPALLRFAGASLTPKQKRKKNPGRFARLWVGAATRIPALTIAFVVAALAVLALPAQDLRLALPDNGSSPHGSTQRTAYELVEKQFGPGFNGALIVNADLITTTDPVGVVDALAADLGEMDGVEAIGLATPNPTGDTGIVQVIPKTGPDDQRTSDLVKDIRDRAPQLEKKYGITVSVTGQTAVGVDISRQLRDALLPFALVVVGLSLLLLTAVFRSLLVPLKATIGYLLSVGASFGAVVAVFQWGWLGSAVNLEQTGPLISFLPIILMGVLFGLAMDYEVFLVSRMKEEFLLTGDANRAITDGFVGSSRVVTAAAVIMFAVFASFVPEGDASIKPIAFALAIGVFVDAFLVRMLLVPAVLKVFGRLAWALPKRLDKALPHFDIEGDALHRQIELTSWPSKDSPAAISAAGLTSTGPEGTIFNDVNIDLGAGDWLVVHGPKGSGKTSLLLTLAGRMAFDDGLLRVNGHLLPQESSKVRRTVALAEFAGINDLEDNLTVDQHIAEQVSISSFGVWVRKSTIAPIRESLNDALEKAHADAGLPFHTVIGTELVSTLPRLERKLLSASLALINNPHILVIEDVDDLRSGEHIALLWDALTALLDGRDVTVVASVQSASSAPPHSPHVHLLELNTTRMLQELMF